jgi:hypothetical protein
VTASLILTLLASSDKAVEQNDHSSDQQEVYQFSSDVANKPENPQQEQDYKNCK